MRPMTKHYKRNTAGACNRYFNGLLDGKWSWTSYPTDKILQSEDVSLLSKKLYRTK